MPDILTPSDLIDGLLAEMETRRTWLTDGFSVGPITWDADAITIPAHHYWIEWDRISTPDKLVEWCEHLRRKTWFDAEHLSGFVTVWLEVYRLKRSGVNAEHRDKQAAVNRIICDAVNVAHVSTPDWATYERFKRAIQRLNLEPREYEIAMRRVANALRL